jgi:hypothetical protein
MNTSLYYTVHVKRVLWFCIHVVVLQNGNTRLLSLLPAIDRIRHTCIFEGLKIFIISRIMSITNQEVFWWTIWRTMYLKLVVKQLNLFHRTVLQIEENSLSATAVVCELKNLKTNLQDRKVFCSIGNYFIIMEIRGHTKY